MPSLIFVPLVVSKVFRRVYVHIYVSTDNKKCKFTEISDLTVDCPTYVKQQLYLFHTFKEKWMNYRHKQFSRLAFCYSSISFDG